MNVYDNDAAIIVFFSSMRNKPCLVIFLFRIPSVKNLFLHYAFVQNLLLSFKSIDIVMD